MLRRRSRATSAVGTAALVACAVGCGSSAGWSSSYQRDASYHAGWSWGDSYRAAPERRDAPPDHGLSEAQVAAALADRPSPDGRALGAPELAPAAWPEAPVREAAAAVAAQYRRGEREQARALVAAHPGLLDWTDPEVVVSCRFVGGLEGIELMCIRTDTTVGAPREALAVCFEPGTYGVPALEAGTGGSRPSRGLAERRRGRWTTPDSERRFGHWPEPQDLALLRAPVLVIPEGEVMAVAHVPVACASFQRGAPDAGAPYTLARFPQGSRIDRVMTVLCQGEETPGDAEAQLAVWLARDDVSWADFVAQGGDRGRLVTFGRPRSVRAGHAAGAARLLLEAGIDPRPLRFFDPTGGAQQDAAPGSPAEAATEPTPPHEPAEPESPERTPEPGSHLS